jgi:TonB family protein
LRFTIVRSASDREEIASVTVLAWPGKNGKHPPVRSPSRRFTRLRQPGKPLTLALVILFLSGAAVTAARADQKTDLGSHLPRVEHPFALTAAQWNSLFEGTAPDGKRLAAQQLAPLVIHAYWPSNSVYTRAHWHLKIGVYLLNVSGDGTVSSIGILQRIGHPQMDGAIVRAFAKWRFRPNSVKVARVPAYFNRVD